MAIGLLANRGMDFAEHMVDYPAVEIGHQVESFGRRNKDVWHDQLTFVIAHPQQQLAMNILGLAIDRDDGLEEQFETALLARRFDPRHPFHFVVALRAVMTVVITTHLVATTIFCGEAGDIGRAEQLRHRIVIRADQDQADTGGNTDRLAFPGKAGIEYFIAKFFRDLFAVGQVAIHQHHGEFVAIETREKIAVACLGLDDF